MTTLYDLGEELNLIVEQVQDLLNDGIDPSDERVQELLEKMVSQEDEWELKAVNVAKFLHQVESDQDQIQAEIDRLNKKKKSLSNAHASLHDLLMYQMEVFGKQEIKNSVISVKIKENPISVVIKDESLVPKEFKTEKITTTVNKVALKKAHESGAKFDGVEFVRNKKLSIK